MSGSSVIVSVCVLGVVAIEIMALKLGVNGVSLATSIGAIAGLGGYHLKQWKEGKNATRTRKS